MREVRHPIFSFNSAGGGRDASVSVFFEMRLYFECGHTSTASRSDGLAIAPVLNVAASKHSRNFREDVLVRDEIAIGIGIELALKDLGIGNVPDAKKHSAGGKLPALAAFRVAQS